MSSAGIRWDTNGFNAHLRAMADAADRATREAVAEGAGLIQRKMQENSSGRPGPKVVSGAHRAGIRTEGPTRVAGASGMGWQSRIFPTSRQARALEEGHPRWKPGVKYPYAGPAIEWARNGPIAEVFRRAWVRVHR